MTTLIVGCGYLGMRVAMRLSEAGETVLGTTRRATAGNEFRALGIEPVILDVLQPESTALPDFDRLVYCVGFDRGAGYSRRLIYVDGLIRFLRHLGNRHFSFIYTSSTSVYGQDDGSTVTEEDLTEPRNEAGAVCLESEQIASERGASILRLAGLYGPGRIIRRAALLAGEPIIGDPEKVVNLIHVDDAATAVIAALVVGQPSRVYNVADDSPLCRRDLYTLTATCLDATVPQFRSPEAGSKGEEANRRIGNLRMKKELGVLLKYPSAGVGIPASIASLPSEP